MSQTIFLISGLGADERMFQRLDFTGFTPIFLEWIPPKKTESLSEYARRLAVQITEENPIIIGYSLGGMVAIEMAKFLKTKKIILLASIKTKKELPLLYKIAGSLRLDFLVPKNFYKKANWFIYWLFGANSREAKQLLKEVLRDSNILFVVWAVNQVLHWKNEYIPPNVVTVHGTKDYLLPLRSKPDYSVENGTHLMVFTKSEEISKILHQIIT